MGLFDDLKGKASQLKDKAAKAADEHNDKIDKGIDKAARLANEKTGGKHGDKIRKGAAKAKDAVDGLADGGDGRGRDGRSSGS